MSETISRLNQALHDRYEIEREIGQGGLATVYLARDVRHDRRVALTLRRLDAGSGRWLASVGGGTEPRWGANGTELYYRSAQDRLMAVPFRRDGATPVLGTPRALFEAPFLGWPTEVHYDVTRDGSQFVFLTGRQGEVVMHVVLNRLTPLMR
jgi:hypothetical protein